MNKKCNSESTFWKMVSEEKTFIHGGGQVQNIKIPQNLPQLFPPINSFFCEMFPNAEYKITYEMLMGPKNSFFCWHKDPYGINALNYLWKGGVKHWYVIPSKNRQEFKKLINTKVKKSKCQNEYLHTKVLTKPNLLHELGQKIVQESNDVVLLFNNVYHSGINLGANLCFTANYATPNWIENIEVDDCKCGAHMTQVDCDNIRRRFKKYQENGEKWSFLHISNFKIKHKYHAIFSKPRRYASTFFKGFMLTLLSLYSIMVFSSKN